jgi:hypothetical protein
VAQAVLVPHGSSPTQAVRGFEVRVDSTAGFLNLAYRLTADMSRLRIPAPAPPRRKDELWKHTCFEAFVSTGPAGGYYELNFSPSTEWALYSFRGYRNGMTEAPIRDEWPPRLTVRRTASGLELDAVVQLASLPLAATDLPLRLALSGVVEEESGESSYWALSHPSARADFHHPESFTLEIRA